MNVSGFFWWCNLLLAYLHKNLGSLSHVCVNFIKTKNKNVQLMFYLELAASRDQQFGLKITTICILQLELCCHYCTPTWLQSSVWG